MAWTYDPTQFASAAAGTYPGSTIGERNQIRFLIQDTQTLRQLMQDEEIDWQQTKEANGFFAAAACCEQLVARAGGVTSKTVGPFSLGYDPMVYRGLAASLRARGCGHQVPYAGGISIADKTAQQDNADAVQPAFFRGIFDNRRAAQPSPGPPETPLQMPTTV